MVTGMGRKYFDVVVLGGINSDFIVRGKGLPQPGETVPGDSFYQGAGGKGANQAVAAARLGARVAFIGCIGDDQRGKELLQTLAREKVDITGVVRRKRFPTGAAVIAVDASGEKQIATAPGANLQLRAKDVRARRKYFEACTVLLMQFESPDECLLEAARLGKTSGAIVVLDPAPARKMPAGLAELLDVVRPNAAEAEALTGIQVKDRASARKAAAKLLKSGPRIAALETGGKGDLLVTAEQEILLPRLKVRSVDATGAGDAFAAGLAVGLAEGLALEQIAKLANATAALATTKIGAQEGLPRRRTVETLIKKGAAQS